MKSPLPPILFEDATLLAFDKPAGLLVSPDRRDAERANLMDLVRARLSPDWSNTHRLDREASGVLLCARGKPALREVCRLLESGGASKEYMALVQGSPADEQGVIRLRLEPDPAWPGRTRVAHGRSGKPAETRYSVMERWRGYALLRLEPLTNRTHQMRIHLSASGWPIVADRFYGGKPLYLSWLKPKYKFKKNKPERPLMGRLALHAQRLSFTHPLAAAPVAIEAPLPKDFRVAIRYLQQWASSSRPARIRATASAQSG